jgi:hypothetical protein
MNQHLFVRDTRIRHFRRTNMCRKYVLLACCLAIAAMVMLSGCKSADTTTSAADECDRTQTY